MTKTHGVEILAIPKPDTCKRRAYQQLRDTGKLHRVFTVLQKVLLQLRFILCLCRCICENYSSRSLGSGVSGDARSRLPETWDAEDAGRLERVTEWEEYHAANNLPSHNMYGMAGTRKDCSLQNSGRQHIGASDLSSPMGFVVLTYTFIRLASFLMKTSDLKELSVPHSRDQHEVKSY
ncbi:hypothetical protein CEK26_008347 [Fusarium fujikuroi]|uniref:Uncharacterized protein n=1 Tax=Fusarium fujikuroi TaxID=5127 RepID=A0A5Q3DCC7_FUSFU|nr:Uncharacterized protein Y057_2399 [Fusarium fujikuroi]QGI64393.1 hypothetical protein CEK27_008364 [Fusarium fujikuroi]QGI81656.1 hypothetical protein CEK25_008385 [Fusarium fujikuroi]QGI95278.1 hypothetical protein CEK26_008347 [Fusarium fujikuroi]VTT58001.1 unnamed protein product [Fusarium fujikuroi]